MGCHLALEARIAVFAASGALYHPNLAMAGEASKAIIETVYDCNLGILMILLHACTWCLACFLLRVCAFLLHCHQVTSAFKPACASYHAR